MTYKQESFMELAQKAKRQKPYLITSKRRNEYRYTLYPDTIKRLNRFHKLNIKKSHILRIAVEKLAQEHANNKNKCLKKIYKRYISLLVGNSNMTNHAKKKIIQYLMSEYL